MEKLKIQFFQYSIFFNFSPSQKVKQNFLKKENRYIDLQKCLVNFLVKWFNFQLPLYKVKIDNNPITAENNHKIY